MSDEEKPKLICVSCSTIVTYPARMCESCSEGCYLCRLLMTHSPEEHAEVLKDGLKTHHPRKYRGMSSFKDQRFPTESYQRTMEDLTPEERLKLYMSRGTSRRKAVNKVQSHYRNKRYKEDSAMMTLEQFNDLTDREREILEYVAQGMSNKQIAEKIDRAEKTVKQHITAIHSKLGVHNRTTAALAYSSYKRKQRESKNAGERSQSSEAKTVTVTGQSGVEVETNLGGFELSPL